MIGLFKAVRDYQTDQDTSFYSFAKLCITRQMYSAIEGIKEEETQSVKQLYFVYEQGEDRKYAA